LDDEEVTLKAGDGVVLRNVIHGWRNEGSMPVRLLMTAVGVGA
jgi:quercetin dioxygenase-like cupin family protein